MTTTPEAARKRGPYPTVKRAIDLVLSAGALVVLSPVCAVLAVLVRMKLGSPVLFGQARPGRDAVVFKLYKFRTMTEARDADANLLADADRITPFGARLRSLSLDELPELWNVLRGDMSIVGPRPLHVRYLGRFSPTQARRHEVRPGITGLAQVSGRNALSWDDRFGLDVEYVDSMSLRQDISIIARTVKSVISKDGINADGHATMPEFTGSHKATMVLVGSGPLADDVLALVHAQRRTADVLSPARVDTVAVLQQAVVGSDVGAQGVSAVVVEGRPAERRAAIEEIASQRLGVALALVHPLAGVGVDVTIGPGSVVLAGAQLVTHVVMGRHCVIGVNAVVSHDCVLGDNVVLGPGVMLNGNVVVGSHAVLESGVVVVPGVVIGESAVVEAGSVVVHRVEAGQRVSGCPARSGES